jgi:acyl carrier protein
MLEKYDNVFIECFGVKKSDLENLQYQDVKAWDSVGHMAMVGELEDTFEIEMDIEDIIDISSYTKGKEILGRYGVEV